MAAKVRTRSITMYLARAGYRAADVLREVAGAWEEDVGGPGWSGRLYLFRPPGKELPWLTMLRSELAHGLPKRHSLTASAILTVEDGAVSRGFVVTFGHVRHRLDLALVVPDFGLRVTLNSTNPDEIRSLDARAFEEQTVRSRRQVAGGARVDVFGIDVQRDLVSAVTGRSTDVRFGAQISGRDSLRISVRHQFDELGELCGHALETYGNDAYKQRYGWIDNVRAVHDPSDQQRLFETLIRQAQSDPSAAALEPPELVDWAQVDGFVYEHDRGRRPGDLDLSSVLTLLAGWTAAQVREILRVSHVLLMRDGDEVDSWTLLSCLTGSVGVGDARFILDRGSWYRLDQAFADSIDAEVDSLPTSGLLLAPYETRDMELGPNGIRRHSEGKYNVRLARSPGLALLDKRNITLPGRSAVEPCDLLSEAGHFVHVKRAAGSSTLSHLFAQGAVSGELFVREEPFRGKLTEQLALAPRRIRALASASRGDRAVVFATISDRGDPRSYLPFFSKIALVQATQRLRGLGLKVYLDGIDDRSVVAPSAP